MIFYCRSKKGRYEIYLTDGTKVILPIGGTVGEVGTGDDVGGFESSQLPNYTKYINVKGGETPTAKNESKKCYIYIIYPSYTQSIIITNYRISYVI
mgnify:CR=1 FL=1